MFGGIRWCFTTCALFMLWPRRSYVAASVSQKWINSVKLSTPSIPIRSKSIPSTLTPVSSIPLRSLVKPLMTITSIISSLPIPRPSRIIGNLISNFPLKLVGQNKPTTKPGVLEYGFDFTAEEMKKLKIWPGGAIPYYIDEFSFDKVFRDRIRNFLDVTNTMSGLNFLELPRPPGDEEARWVFFVNRQGLLSCVDHPFKNFTNEGVQKILLGYDCLSSGAELAETILALVGVPPQHNAPDRNKYIAIAKENIMPGKANLFEILKDNEWLFHEIDYDFASASHYNLHKYTVNGQATIKPLESIHGINIGEGKGFSYTDIIKIRMIYNYISKKRLKSVGMPECNKLFSLGSNFSKYVPTAEGDIQPRKKPNKYLGLPDTPNPSEEEEKSASQETHNETKADSQGIGEEVTKEENEEENNVDEQENIVNDSQVSNNTKDKLILMISKSNEIFQNSGQELNDDNQADESNPNQSDSKPDDLEDKPRPLKFRRPGKKKAAK